VERASVDADLGSAGLAEGSGAFYLRQMRRRREHAGAFRAHLELARRHGGMCACALAATTGLMACSTPVNEDAPCSAPIVDIGPTITPTCSTATPPAALGGKYADGTYVLASETFYQSGNCVPGSPVSQTLRVAGSCEEWAGTGAASSDGGANGTLSGSTLFSIQGNQIVGSELNTESFTATATTLTFYFPCGNGVQNCVAGALYTKQ
jgi:hypothetical protein